MSRKLLTISVFILSLSLSGLASAQTTTDSGADGGDAPTTEAADGTATESAAPEATATEAAPAIPGPPYAA